MGLDGAGGKASVRGASSKASVDASDVEGLLSDAVPEPLDEGRWPGLRDQACLRHLAGALPDQAVVGLILLTSAWCWYKGSLIEGSPVKQELLVGLLLMTVTMLVAVIKVWLLRPMQDELAKMKAQNKTFLALLEVNQRQLATSEAHLEAASENNQELTRQIEDLSSVKDKLEVYGKQHNLTVSDLLDQITLGTEEQRKLRDQTALILQHQAAWNASKRFEGDDPELGSPEELLREVRSLLDGVGLAVDIDTGCSPRRARELMAAGLRQQRGQGDQAPDEAGRCRPAARSPADALRSPPPTSRSGVSTQVPSTARQRINYGEMGVLYGQSPLSMDTPRYWSTESERNGLRDSDASPWHWPQRQAELAPRDASRQSTFSSPSSPSAAKASQPLSPGSDSAAARGKPSGTPSGSARRAAASPVSAKTTSAQSPRSGCLGAEAPSSPLLGQQRPLPRQGPPGATTAPGGASPLPSAAPHGPAPVAPKAKVSSTPRTGPWASLPAQAAQPRASEGRRG